MRADQASGKKDERPGLEACLKALREGDTLIVWKLDRLGRNLRHLVNTIHDLMERGICFRVLTGQGANIDTTTASGRLVFGIFAALAEFERELIRERTIAGLSSARARGRNGGRPYTMTPAKLRLAQAAMAKRDTKVSDLCTELGVTRQTLYRFVGPKEGGGVTRKRRNNPMQRQNWLTKIPTGARDLRLLNCYPCLSSSAKAARDCLISSDK
jgi:DNA invertase Pin-like site-specific DNA recombinase